MGGYTHMGAEYIHEGWSLLVIVASEVSSE